MSGATTHVGRAFRPDRSILIGLAWRAAIVVAAAVAVAAGAPSFVRAPLSGIAAVVVILWYVRRVRRRGVMDTWLIATGVSISVLALLGLGLNLLPVGLSAGGWALGVGALELVVLVLLALARAPIERTRTAWSPPFAAIAWGASIVVVLAGAIVWSAVSFQQTHVSPLSLEAEPDGSAFVVTVTSGSDEGPFRMDLVTDSSRTVLARDLRVGPGHDARTTVRLAQGDRALVQLIPADAASPVRELILDRTRAGAP